MSKQVRILTDVLLDGTAYHANDVVEFSNKTAKALCDAGAADGEQAAIDYCVNELSAKVQPHVATLGDPQADDTAPAK